MFFMETYFGPDVIEGIENFLETGICITDLKKQQYHVMIIITSSSTGKVADYSNTDML